VSLACIDPVRWRATRIPAALSRALPAAMNDERNGAPRTDKATHA
jgi:hypothetical protein